MAAAERTVRAGAEFESIIVNAFRKAGWRIHRQPAVGDMRVDLVAEANGRKYVIEVKRASEARSDRLIPLLSQAILQVRAFAQGSPDPVVPVVVMASRQIPASVAEHLQQFAERHAPDVGIGVIDAHGLRSFAGHGLEKLDAKPSRGMERRIAWPQRVPDLFSDLNQWMLKVLLGQRLPESLLSVPREAIRNSSHLARIAGVSVMSASRLVKQLGEEGFLDERRECLAIVRADELLERWVSANRQRSGDLPARWIVKKDEKQLFASLAQYAGVSNAAPGLKSNALSRVVKALPRCCIGLFAAADVLGLGFVRGVPPHLYLERLDSDVLNRLGLSMEGADQRADVRIRIPSNKEAIFRAMVMHEGLPVSDVLQIWLDASAHPARGLEQADEIRRRVLMPLFRKQR